MAASTTSAGAAPSRQAAPDPVVDRALWVRLRRAAAVGHLQPEGFALVDELHELHPEWRAEWSQW
jgi:hypothetical protein